MEEHFGNRLCVTGERIVELNFLADTLGFVECYFTAAIKYFQLLISLKD